MAASLHGTPLSPLAQRGIDIYERDLRAELEPAHTGGAVAIHVDSGDYAVGRTHAEAARTLLARHERDGRIVTLTIGGPTDRDLRLMRRLDDNKR